MDYKLNAKLGQRLYEALKQEAKQWDVTLAEHARSILKDHIINKADLRDGRTIGPLGS